MAKKCACKPLFEDENIGYHFRDATLYLRTAYDNGNYIAMSELQYPLNVTLLSKQQWTVGSETPSQVSNVVDNGIFTHIFQISSTVDLLMLDYSNSTVKIPQPRNIVIMKDYSNITSPNGDRAVYKIINPDIVTDLNNPQYKTLYCKLLGIIDDNDTAPGPQASVRF